MLLLLLACPSAKEDTADTRTCDDALVEFQAESETIRTCSDASECGQVLTGTSCGCTNDLVARTDANTDAFYALLHEVATCGDAPLTDCGCPYAFGYACEDNRCTWDYAGMGGAYFTCDAEGGADYTVAALSLSGDTLTVTVTYAGGCEDHVFTTCWPDGAFAESDPVQASLELFHDSGGDTCEAGITEDVAVDLAPLRSYWTTLYGASSGTIEVHLGGQSVTYSF